ncbi:MAG: glycosyltransferase [Actinomycetota bacterium]|nr:glycosyltransferase [Actinomycetota bacterium]
MTAPGRPGPVVLVTSKPVFHPRHYHLMARGLERAGLPVVVVGQPIPGHEPESVPVEYLPARRGRLARMLSGPAVLRRALRLRPSLLQVNSLELLPWGVLARVVARVPVIYDSNEDYASYMLIKQWLPRPLRRPLSWLVGVLEPWLAARLDGMTVADTLTAERFRRSGRRPVIVVHNFPWRSMAESPVSSQWRYDVTYHGSLPPYHVDAILETARLLRERGLAVRWCLAAREFSDAEQRELRERVAAAGLEREFTLLFNLPFGQMPELMAATRLGFIPLPDTPKFRRNIPRKIFEFMGAGRPAVASDLPATRRVVGDAGCCLLVAPGDERAYADGLERLLRDDALADELGRRGRLLIQQSLNAETQLDPYVRLCASLSGALSDAGPS